MLQSHFSSYVPGRVLQSESPSAEHKFKKGLHHLEESNTAHPKVEGIYPYPRRVFNGVYYSLEMAYEFIRGARVAPTSVLDVCETRITNYALQFASA